MFSRGVRTLVSLLLVFSMLLCSAAMAKTYTIDEAIALIGTEEGRKNNGRVEISDDLSAYDYFSSPEYTLNEGKFLVLYRVGPEKEFTVSKEAFADTFNGVDKTAPKVYLCTGIMENIPEEKRATSLADAGNILIFDSFYMHTATISTSKYTEAYNRNMDIAIAKALMGDTSMYDELIKSERPTYEYKPVFTGYVAPVLYNAADGSSFSFEVQEFPHSELRDNPAAADIADELFALGACHNACKKQDDLALLSASLELVYYDNIMNDLAFSTFINLQSSDTPDYAAMEACLDDMIWNRVDKIAELDSSRAAEYSLAKSRKNLQALSMILNSSEYSGVSMSESFIRSSKAYMGAFDLDVLDSMVDVTVETMELLEWDVTPLYTLMMNEY